LTAAFDDAWAKLQASRAPFAEEGHASAAREILAKQIIMAAKRGERNIRYLSQDALGEVNLSDLLSHIMPRSSLLVRRGGASTEKSCGGNVAKKRLKRPCATSC
jgi:hypothetical protein